MSQTTTPGGAAMVACISSDCRKNRGDEGAIEEALDRARKVLRKSLANWDPARGATFYVVVTVDREGRKL